MKRIRILNLSTQETLQVSIGHVSVEYDVTVPADQAGAWEGVFKGNLPAGHSVAVTDA